MLYLFINLIDRLSHRTHINVALALNPTTAATKLTNHINSASRSLYENGRGNSGRYNEAYSAAGEEHI